MSALSHHIVVTDPWHAWPPRPSTPSKKEYMCLSSIQLVFICLNNAYMHCRYKPGWVTNKPESDFTVILDTLFLNMNVTTVSVRLAYLSSYEHMGQAHVSCLSGCTCSPQNVDAHEVRAKVSVQQAIEFDVTQAPACTIRIHTLSTTSSGGHKFKLIQLTVKGRLA